MRRRPGRQQWKPVPGFEGLYEISERGLVWSCRRRLVLKEFANRDGYQHVSLHKNGRQHTIYIHRIVARAFIGTCPADMEVLHGDGNKAHNWRTNLRYGTRGENTQDQVTHGTHAGARKKTCKHGHPLDGRHKNGKRYCKQCNRNRRKANYEANRESEKQKMRDYYQRKMAA